MKKLTNNQKQVCGGIGPMMAWVAIMGVAMIGSMISNVVTSVTDKVTATDNPSKSYSYSSSKKSTYVRMSPFPNRSAVSMWL